ncbi:hypothetical protein C8R43DRAFT_1127364 [Mycena crocata]|nr:hypothetical protein C8R43DRAFT_1127357 [Mycena crocata]KAJ7152292.1 hypothetical protein C8R43DRAFT_1127364 [Mycena crocata]
MNLPHSVHISSTPTLRLSTSLRTPGYATVCLNSALSRSIRAGSDSPLHAKTTKLLAARSDSTAPPRRRVVLLPCRHLVACRPCAVNMVEFGAGGAIVAEAEPATSAAPASTTAASRARLVAANSRPACRVRLGTPSPARRRAPAPEVHRREARHERTEHRLQQREYGTTEANGPCTESVRAAASPAVRPKPCFRS